MVIAEKEEITFIRVNCEKYANIVFYNNIYTNRKIVRDYLLGKSIECIGRFGEWDYLWSDQSMMSGYNASKNIKMM